jgi:signal transduction histidine kinase
MGLQITSMIVGLLLISGASLWGLNGLRQDYGAAVEGYLEMRQIFEVGSEVNMAKSLLGASNPQPWQVVAQLQKAITRFEAAKPWRSLDAPVYEPMRTSLNDAMIELRAWERAGGPPPTAGVNKVLHEIADTVALVRTRVETSQAAAEAKRRTTLYAVGLLCGGITLAAVLLGLWQYKGVMNPLHRLSGAVRRVATGQFGVRILESGMPRGDNEFAGLAADFNRMATKLDSYYRDLEQKVAAKSKELIRSERLASVGYLAAGVAHEINNPLGIISGYAEYALAEMKRGGGNDGNSGNVATADIDGTLRVIRDEAFRCKDITGKLLSLARPGDGQRQRVNLADVAENVVSVLAGLRDFKERKITVRSETRQAPPVVDAVEGEMKQVLMNLLINALEATADNDNDDGEVRVTVSRATEAAAGNSTVTLAVSDNGRGMTPDTLEHVFEPFFTERRSRDPDSPPRPGTGLGLSITHAIVQAHRGRITAHSDGPGRGSRFVIELPAAREEAASFTQGKV